MVSWRDYFTKTTFPAHLDPASPTMDKKLVINVSITGAFIKRWQNPNQAFTPKEVARHVIEAYKEGASMWHVHVRDEEGVPYITEAEPAKEAVDLVLDACPDIISSHSGHIDISKEGADSLRPLVEPLAKATAASGRKYMDTMVLVPARTGRLAINEKILKEMVEYLHENGVKPEFQNYNYTCVRHVDSWLIQPSLIKKPYIMNILMGYHGSDYVAPTGPDPWGHIYLYNMMQTIPKGSIIGATIGGHNWLPITVSAIMAGVDCVRIGMEDTIWMYPHKNELLKSCADVVRKVATIARELGRDIATPAETRKILGLD